MARGTDTPLAHAQHSGSRPMQIEWKLERAMPAEMLVAARAVA
ncbi:hypothetical protein [Brevibacterium luteolum]